MGGQGKLQTGDWKGQEEDPERALRNGFWCIQEEVFMRPLMGEGVTMLEEFSVRTQCYN